MIDAFTSPFSLTCYEIFERSAICRSFRTQWPIWMSFQNGGGYLEYDDYDGRRVTWVAMTNYPRPYWNEWAIYVEHDAFRVYGPFDSWWYGEWVVTTESGGPFDLLVVPAARPRSFSE